jgi:hypothetical protein
MARFLVKTEITEISRDSVLAVLTNQEWIRPQHIITPPWSRPSNISINVWTGATQGAYLIYLLNQTLRFESGSSGIITVTNLKVWINLYLLTEYDFCTSKLSLCLDPASLRWNVTPHKRFKYIHSRTGKYKNCSCLSNLHVGTLATRGATLLPR